MMRKIILALLLVCSVAIQASEPDSVEVSVYYSASYHLYKGAPLMKDTTCVLDIGKYSSHFYSHKAKRRHEISDSLLAIGAPPMNCFDEWKKNGVSGPEISYQIFKNLPQRGTLTYIEKLMGFYTYEEKMPTFSWNLEEGDSVVLGYHCMKASTLFRGRKWTVYYTDEIPMDNGPWKLSGLPGLILSANEAKGDFSFRCLGIEKGKKTPIVLRTEKCIKCTHKRIQQLQKLEFANRKAFEEQTLGVGGEWYDPKGRRVIEKPKTTCLLEIIDDAK